MITTRRIQANALVLAALPSAALASDGGGTGHSVIANIAVCVVAACLVGLVMKVLRLPLILAYILAGVMIGPIGLRVIASHEEIITISEIGLILLLFMIGLEIDLQKMLASGRLVIVAGILQFPICTAAAWGALWMLQQAGLPLGDGYVLPYIAVAVSLSSTMIVVKLLYDKFELDTLPGRITLGILVFQDIWAIIVLAAQPSIANPQLGALARTFGAGALLVCVSLLVSKHVLPRVFRSVAKLPELMLILSLGWCFLICLLAAHPRVGLSMEMGALIAGISLATFPYNLDVIGKVVTIRDFFITLFFVALGMQIPLPTIDVVGAAAAIALVAVAVRFPGVFGVLYPMRAGHRASLLATINLAQISEFSLVILSLGVGFGHIPAATVGQLVWVFSILAVASTYLVAHSHRLQAILSRMLTLVGLRDLGTNDEAPSERRHHPIVVLGFFRIASAFLHEVTLRHQHMLPLIKVVDFNPVVKQALDRMGIACVYGDISHRETLHHADLHDARVVLCTIPDALLKGTNNQNLMGMVRSMCPHAKIILTAESPGRAQQLYAAGADYVIQPYVVTGEAMMPVVEQALHDALAGMREQAMDGLSRRQEVLG